MFLADLHCDTALPVRRGYDLGKRHTSYHIDIPRLQEGGVTFQMFALFVDASVHITEQFSTAERHYKSLMTQFEQHHEQIVMIKSLAEAKTIMAEGRIAAMLSAENGMIIENSLEKLEKLYQWGVQSLTLTHAASHSWCSSSSDEHAEAYGLTPFGREVISKMNQLGMIIDVSHISQRAFYNVLETTTAPVIASHSNAHGLCGHDRNLTDQQLKSLAQNGGLTGINFCSDFLTDSFRVASAEYRDSVKKEIDEMVAIFLRELPESEYQAKMKPYQPVLDGWLEATPRQDVTIDTLVEHIAHIADLVGVDYIAFGSDFDGITYPPIDCPDCSHFPAIIKVLRQKGFSEEEIEKICWGNIERVLNEICPD